MSQLLIRKYNFKSPIYVYACTGEDRRNGSFMYNTKSSTQTGQNYIFKYVQNLSEQTVIYIVLLNSGESLHVYRSGNRLVLIGKFIRILRGIAFIAALTMKTRNKITFSVIFRKERHNHGMYLFSKRKQRERNTITDCTVTKTHPIEVYKRKFICKNINYCPYSSETVNQS